VRWADLDATAATLRIEDPSGLRSRTVPVPQGLLPMFQGLAAISLASAPMVCGRPDAKSRPRGLCVRQAERIVQKAGLRSGVLKRFTPTNLRSTYAHRRLACPEQGAQAPRRRAGHNIRAVQDAMGHRSIRSTMRYKACILPDVTSPADPESQGMIVRQMNVLLGRLAMALPALPARRSLGAGGSLPNGPALSLPNGPALSLPNGPAIQSTKPQGP
jgi:integrase